jgi:hypothetical protein
LDHNSATSDLFFDLDNLLNASQELGCLSDPFSSEEIDFIVQILPHDKSPGPDGFNTDFLKKCWPIIKYDFYDLCTTFHLGKIFAFKVSMGLTSP